MKEDNSIEAMVHQGKSIAQWEKDFNGEFTAEQLAKMAKGSVDLQKLLYSDDLNEEDDQLLDAKEFFEEAAKESELEETTDEEVALSESSDDPEDVVTVKDFIHLLREKTDLNDKLSFRANKKECVLVDVDSKSGTSVVDLVYGKDKMLENEEDMKESYSWRRGGYGGTGRSYSSLGDRAPRGAAIGWFNVDEIDPKAKGKMYGWRMGPSNFPFEDLLYPERKYKVGTTTMRNKYVKAGSMSGEKYIAIPSYFSAIKDNDQEAINLLNALGIPLDLTFGMDPNDDYSMTYTVKS